MAEKKRIFISGVSGYLARGLLPPLEKDSKVGSIVGVDRQPLPQGLSKKCEFHQADVRDPSIDALFKGCHTFVHLAFILLSRPGQKGVDEINIGASIRMMDAAAAAGVKKIVFTSSAVGYGFHPDNPIPLTEKNPLRPNEDLYYSRAKGVVEAHLDELEKKYPKLIVTRLRPCTVVGPTAEKGRVASLISKTGILVAGYNPPIQLLHEEDLYQALALAISQDLPGVFNVTPNDSKTLKELYAISHTKITEFALPIARFLMGLAWRFGGSLFAPDWLPLSMYSIVASNRKLKTQGWKPKYDTVQTFKEVLRSNGVTV
jgi:UDP-glucose 4-epimerase